MTKEREWMVAIVFGIFNDRHSIPWYKHQILFHVIEIFDRYLHHLFVSGKQNIPKSQNEGNFMTEEECGLKIMVCIYLCIKYFIITRIPCSFSQIVQPNYSTPEMLAKAENFEIELILDLDLSKQSQRIYRFFKLNNKVRYRKRYITRHGVRKINNGSPLP